MAVLYYDNKLDMLLDKIVFDFYPISIGKFEFFKRIFRDRGVCFGVEFVGNSVCFRALTVEK